MSPKRRLTDAQRDLIITEVSRVLHETFFANECWLTLRDSAPLFNQRRRYDAERQRNQEAIFNFSL